MSQTVAAEGIRAKKNYVNYQNQRAYANTKMPASVGSGKPHRLDRVVPENDDEDQSKIKKITMNVL